MLIELMLSVMYDLNKRQQQQQQQQQKNSIFLYYFLFYSYHTSKFSY